MKWLPWAFDVAKSFGLPNERDVVQLNKIKYRVDV